MHGRVALATLSLLLLAAAPAAATVPAGNLLTNPGAEAGPGSPDSSTLFAPPTWVVTGELTAVQYGAPAFLTVDDGNRVGGGTNFFAGGNAEQSEGAQSIDVSGAAAEIDAGTLQVTLSALLGGYASQSDHATVSASFVSGSAQPVGSPLELQTVTAADRKSVTTLLPRTATGTVPVGTRGIIVTIAATRGEGSYNDGYVDNVSLSLGEGAPPPVFHKTVTAGVVSGTIKVRKPGAKTFVTITADQSLPLGSVLDTKHGVMELTSVPKPGGKPQTARFYNGLFKVTQPGAITQLKLTETLAPCGKGAHAAAKKPKSRRLWGSGKGAFRISGQYSAATVRGTKWLVQDSCAGTLTRVTSGAVSVRDSVRRKTVVVRAGHRYLAKPKR
jgi:hypothetical protein